MVGLFGVLDDELPLSYPLEEGGGACCRLTVFNLLRSEVGAWGNICLRSSGIGSRRVGSGCVGSGRVRFGRAGWAD